MIHPHIAPLLSTGVWMALQKVSHHIESLPIPDDAKRLYQKDVEGLTGRLVMASKQHNLTYPIGG
jgi:hypothetical protein